MGSLTDECLLAQGLSLNKVMLPLEQSQSLVDQGQDVDAHGLALFLHFDGLVELLDGLGEVLLVEQKLTVVVVHVRYVLEVLDRPAESSHGGGHGAHLVLGHTELDVRENEGAVEVDRLLVVLGGLGELAQDEVELGAVVVDIGVILVVGDGKFEVIGSSILVSCSTVRKACGGREVTRLTELQVQAGALDVALDKGGLQLHALVQVRERTSSVAAEVCESGAHVKSQGLKLLQAPNLESLLKRRGSILITITGLLTHGNQTAAEQTLAGVLAQLNRLLQALGKRHGTEALQIVGDESGTGQLLGARIQDSLALLLSNLLQQTLKRAAADLVGEAIDNAAGSEVEEGLTVLAEMFVGNGSPVQGFHVLAVHGERGASILHNLLPLRQDVVAGGAVRVENGIGLADNGLAVQNNRIVVVLGAIGLVTGGLQLGGILLPGLPSIVSDCRRVNRLNG